VSIITKIAKHAVVKLSNCCTVLVTGLPKGFTQDYLELIFENEAKSGGGPISCFVPEPGPAPCRALITFEQAHGNVL
jgi:hypothetical protein